MKLDEITDGKEWNKRGRRFIIPVETRPDIPVQELTKIFILYFALKFKFTSSSIFNSRVSLNVLRKVKTLY